MSVCGASIYVPVQIVYYDGQFDDARLNVTLACTAALAGAAVLNHTTVTSLIKVRCLPGLHLAHADAVQLAGQEQCSQSPPEWTLRPVCGATGRPRQGAWRASSGQPDRAHYLRTCQTGALALVPALECVPGLPDCTWLLLVILKCFTAQVLNATGPFSDKIRHMSDETSPRMIMPSSGVRLPISNCTLLAVWLPVEASGPNIETCS